MKTLAFVTIVVFGFFSFASTLTLKSNAIVSGKYVTLYDLAATFSGISVQTLKNFKVAFAPQPGTYYVIDAKSVKIRAEREIKWLDVLLTSTEIKISSRAFTIGVAKIQQALSTKLATEVFITDFPTVRIPTSDCEIRIKNISEIGDKKFALVEISANDTNTYVNVEFETRAIGKVNRMGKIPKVVNSYLKKRFEFSLANRISGLRFDFIDVGKPFGISKHLMGVPVNFILSSKVVKSAVLKYVVHDYENVVVASRKIGYGQKIENDLLRLERLDVYATTTAYATSFKACVGKLAVWSFLKGQVISLKGLKSPPAVITGQILIAYISYPAMMVTTFVRAMQNGVVGQVIPVRNVENGYMLYGVIEKGPKIRIYSGGE